MFAILPFIAAAVGVALFLLWRRRRRVVGAMAAGAWLAYGVYEYLMHARVLCAGECNIRVDLLLIWPVLIGMTLTALLQRPRPAEPSLPSAAQ